MFLTNSLRFIRPVTALDRQPLPQADLSALVQALCEAARLQCGHDPRMVDLAQVRAVSLRSRKKDRTP